MEHEALGIKTSQGILLTERFLSQTMIRLHGDRYLRYHRHANGGGWVAFNSLVPLDLHLPVDVTVGPCTRLLDDLNIIGLTWIEGSTKNRVQVSRVMTEQDQSELEQQYDDVQNWLQAEQYWELRFARQIYWRWRLAYRYADFQNRLFATARLQAQYDTLYRERLQLLGMM
ncbi:hypothetical protein HY312_04795 [Candidatus Saccharibacteria bacterium]|nr:hypothetical protein [Candidatus Saccharibacteria bacterium]